MNAARPDGSGADGLHSTVRRLVLGPESGLTCWLGAYLAVASIPNDRGLRDSMECAVGVDRLAGMYSARHMSDARALFLFRPGSPLHLGHRDIAAQRRGLRAVFAGLDGEAAQLLDEADRAEAFYFDSITQLLLDTWSRGRVTLVGDAGYCPGPAVGGSTSLAVVGADQPERHRPLHGTTCPIAGLAHSDDLAGVGESLLDSPPASAVGGQT